MRNIKRINRLADFIEEQSERPFNMTKHSTCCMGFLGVLCDERSVNSTRAAELLSITHEQAVDLFLSTPWAPHTMMHEITREQAVAVLREFAETGQYLGGGSR